MCIDSTRRCRGITCLTLCLDISFTVTNIICFDSDCRAEGHFLSRTFLHSRFIVDMQWLVRNYRSNKQDLSKQPSTELLAADQMHLSACLFLISAQIVWCILAYIYVCCVKHGWLHIYLTNHVWPESHERKSQECPVLMMCLSPVSPSSVMCTLSWQFSCGRPSALLTEM